MNMVKRIETQNAGEIYVTAGRINPICLHIHNLEIWLTKKQSKELIKEIQMAMERSKVMPEFEESSLDYWV